MSARKIKVLAYRFGKGAEIHDCSEAPGVIYTSIKDILFSQNIVFSWHETTPEPYRIRAAQDEFGYRPKSIKNKTAVIEAITALAKHVALACLTNQGLPLVVGGDHTQALGAGKGLILAETAKALVTGILPLRNKQPLLLLALENAILQQDIDTIIAQMNSLIQHYIAPGALARFLSSLYVIWFDAHGDYNTESTTPSGNAHGMAAAALSGEGDRALTGIIGHWAKVLPENMYFVAVRDLDSEEEVLMRARNVHLYPMEVIESLGLKQVMEGILLAINGDATAKSGLSPLIHLSFDIDGIDAQYVPATGTPVGEGSLRNPTPGPSLQDTIEAFTAIAEKTALIDLAESNFSPERDPEGVTLRSVNSILSSFFSTSAAETTAPYYRYSR